MQIDPTGFREVRDGTPFLVIPRRFATDVEDVWAAVTESPRMAPWVGVWDGDPATGSVDFRMTAEGEDVPAQRFDILACERPHRLEVRSGPTQDGDVPWRLSLDLSEADGMTTLLFAQSVPSAAWAASVGPGWEYYLDRLTAVETGNDLAAIVFDDYLASQQDAYREMFSGP